MKNLPGKSYFLSHALDKKKNNNYCTIQELATRIVWFQTRIIPKLRFNLRKFPAKLFVRFSAPLDGSLRRSRLTLPSHVLNLDLACFREEKGDREDGERSCSFISLTGGVTFLIATFPY